MILLLGEIHFGFLLKINHRLDISNLSKGVKSSAPTKAVAFCSAKQGGFKI